MRKEKLEPVEAAVAGSSTNRRSKLLPITVCACDGRAVQRCLGVFCWGGRWHKRQVLTLDKLAVGSAPMWLPRNFLVSGFATGADLPHLIWMGGFDLSQDIMTKK